MLDGCFVHGEALQMLRLSLSHCYRALPLAWEVVASAGLVELAVCEAMLEHVTKLLSRTRRVTFLADRGFRDRDWHANAALSAGITSFVSPITPISPLVMVARLQLISLASSPLSGATFPTSSLPVRRIGAVILRSPGRAPRQSVRLNCAW
jgi:hypothetical protein